MREDHRRGFLAGQPHCLQRGSGRRGQPHVLLEIPDMLVPMRLKAVQLPKASLELIDALGPYVANVDQQDFALAASPADRVLELSLSICDVDVIVGFYLLECIGVGSVVPPIQRRILDLAVRSEPLGAVDVEHGTYQDGSIDARLVGPAVYQPFEHRADAAHFMHGFVCNVYDVQQMSVSTMRQLIQSIGTFEQPRMPLTAEIADRLPMDRNRR